MNSRGNKSTQQERSQYYGAQRIESSDVPLYIQCPIANDTENNLQRSVDTYGYGQKTHNKRPFAIDCQGTGDIQQTI
jgi:hypothetical protein